MESHLQLVRELRERLELFSFFHLGSDAEIRYQEDEGGLKVSISHRRVTPFEFTVPWAELEALAGAPDRFEALMLDYLTRYRRS